MTLPAFAQGTLVIVGGGLDPDNEPIYRAVLDRMPADGTLGVLPTASGVPEESGPLTVQDFERYAGPGQKIELIDLRDGEVEKANDPGWADRIAACDALWFTGGDQARIVSTFRHEPVGDANPQLEDGPDTLAYAAVVSVFDRGGVVAGTSAGAAMMSDPMILWGNSHEALLASVVNDVPDFGVGVGPGMGLLQIGVVDQHFRQRGRLGRLLMAMESVGMYRGIGIDEDTALVLGPEGSDGHQIIEVVGAGDVWWINWIALNAFRTESADDIDFAIARLPGGTKTREAELGRLPLVTADEVEELLAGAPRAHEGGLALQVAVLEPDEMDGARFELLPTGKTEAFRTETLGALEEARAKP